MQAIVALAAALTLLIAVPAVALEGDPEEPIIEEVTWYLHGNDQIGELSYVQTLGEIDVMDTNEPAAGDPDSKGITNYLVGPNTNCSGNGLLPSWQGQVRGRMHAVTVTLNTLALPGTTVDVKLFADASRGCNDSASPLTASRTVTLPEGEGEVTVDFGDLSVDVRGGMIMMIHVTNPASTSQGRVFYDSADALSRIDFLCEVPEGLTSCNAR